jgi:hypothetical protein
MVKNKKGPTEVGPLEEFRLPILFLSGGALAAVGRHPPFREVMKANQY